MRWFGMQLFWENFGFCCDVLIGSICGEVIINDEVFVGDEV